MMHVLSTCIYYIWMYLVAKTNPFLAGFNSIDWILEVLLLPSPKATQQQRAVKAVPAWALQTGRAQGHAKGSNQPEVEVNSQSMGMTEVAVAMHQCSEQ